MAKITKYKKVCIIGAGFVGSSVAYALMLRELADEIFLIDINEKAMRAEVDDIQHGLPFISKTKIIKGSYSDISESDLIIMTAGRNRRPNESRLDLIKDNIQIAQSVSDEINKYYTRGIVLIVSNPVDVITYKMIKWLNLPKGKVFGTGCVLDSSRFSCVLADHFDVPTDRVSCFVIGEHGASQVLVWSRVQINQLPLMEYCEKEGISFTETDKENIEKAVRNMGMEIITGKGKTHYGVATCTCYLADSILGNRPIVASVSDILNDEYGVSDVALSVPCVVNQNGLERIIKESLDEEEQKQLHASAEIIKGFLM